MKKGVKKIVVSGAGGQIAYNLLFRIASGEMLGPDQPICLHLLDLPQGLEALKGVVMELEDCAYPLLQEIQMGSDPYQMFANVDYALLVGSKPRGPGMERKDLLRDNGKIFIEQGKALGASASKNVLVFVVGNPCNTNCLIAMHHSKINPKQFFAMTRLDQNRATSLLAKKASAQISDVQHVTIWGNHSSTQVPDFVNATIHGKPLSQIITDRAWCETTFIPAIQKRGAAVIAARGKSSAASAANAVIGSIRSLVFPTKKGEWFSVALFSDHNPYNIKPGLIFSFPCISKGNGEIQIVPDLTIDPFLKEKIALSEQELIEEKAMIQDLL